MPDLSGFGMSRRRFLHLVASVGITRAVAQSKPIPVGLELYSVREDLKRDLAATVRAVARMGYEGVEFFSPYFAWTLQEARQVRQLLDDLNLTCFSTHNLTQAFTSEGLPRAIALNQILGSRLIVMAWPGIVETVDGWKKIAETLTIASEKLRPLGMRAGFHNHDKEWRPIDGMRPMDILAKATPKDFVLQLDVSPCLQMRCDPVAFIKANPGRVNSYHLRDWSDDPRVTDKALLGEGIGRWSEIFEVAESFGGAEFYLLEPEPGPYSALETARRSLENFRRIRGAL